MTTLSSSRGRHARLSRGPVRVLAPEAGDLTIAALHEFLADVAEVAAQNGVDPGGLRPWAAVRKSGTVKGIGVTVPGRRA